MSNRRVQVGDQIEVFGVMRRITRLRSYRGPLYPRVLPDAMIADFVPGPCTGITIEDPGNFCGACSTFWLDCQCAKNARAEAT